MNSNNYPEKCRPKEFMLKENKMRHKKNSKGVVMIELILGVVVLGVIVAMVCAQFAGVLPRLKFKSASTSIVSDLRLARSEAIALKTQFGIYFDFGRNQYTMFKDQINIPSFTYDVGDSVIKTVRLDQDLSIDSCTFSHYTIVFKPDGSASCTGSVVISNSQRGEQANVDVLASNGEIKMIFP
jgi:Tfp pilus assembly protein FimT